MDRFTRNYAISLGAVLLVLVGLWAYSVWNPRVWEINDLLEAEPKLADYPYQFRLVTLDKGMAVLSTPRSAEFPAMRFLALIDPSLANAAQDDPRMVAAQQSLIERQKRAMELLQSQPDVKSVRWELDVRWLAAHGVELTDAR